MGRHRPPGGASTPGTKAKTARHIGRAACGDFPARNHRNVGGYLVGRLRNSRRSDDHHIERFGDRLRREHKKCRQNTA